MADAPPPPPPRSPPPPPPPKSKPSPPPPPKSKPSPPKSRPQERPKKRRGRPPGKPTKRPLPRKGKPGQPPIQKKKRGRRIRIKNRLKTKKIDEKADTYSDRVGWTTSSSETVLSELKDITEESKKEPETTLHVCSMCGVRMQIPTPKRDRYQVICAHPECGHEDRIGY